MCVYLHNVHHPIKVRHTHVLPAEVEEPDLGSHEAFGVVAEPTLGQVARPTVVVLAHLRVLCVCVCVFVGVTRGCMCERGRCLKWVHKHKRWLNRQTDRQTHNTHTHLLQVQHHANLVLHKRLCQPMALDLLLPRTRHCQHARVLSSHPVGVETRDRALIFLGLRGLSVAAAATCVCYMYV